MEPKFIAYAIPTLSKTGWGRLRSRRSLSPREVLRRMVTLRASTTSCVMSASTANSSAVSWRPESSSRPAGSDTTSHTSAQLARRPNAGEARAALQVWAPVALRAPCAQSCHQHQTQPQTTTSRTSDLNRPTYGVRP